MTYELWYSEAECSCLLLCTGDRTMEAHKGPDACVIGTVEADSYDEARAWRDALLREKGLGTLRTVRCRPEEATTRVTLLMYLANGREESHELAGWVATKPYFTEMRLDPTAILGQLWVERPYRYQSEMPDTLTIVDLRSVDGTQRMFQELTGHVHDPELIEQLVARRLGAQMVGWRIEEIVYLNRPPD